MASRMNDAGLLPPVLAAAFGGRGPSITASSAASTAPPPSTTPIVTASSSSTPSSCASAGASSSSVSSSSVPTAGVSISALGTSSVAAAAVAAVGNTTQSTSIVRNDRHSNDSPTQQIMMNSSKSDIFMMANHTNSTPNDSSLPQMTGSTAELDGPDTLEEYRSSPETRNVGGGRNDVSMRSMSKPGGSSAAGCSSSMPPLHHHHHSHSPAMVVVRPSQSPPTSLSEASRPARYHPNGMIGSNKAPLTAPHSISVARSLVHHTPMAVDSTMNGRLGSTMTHRRESVDACARPASAMPNATKPIGFANDHGRNLKSGEHSDSLRILSEAPSANDSAAHSSSVDLSGLNSRRRPTQVAIPSLTTTNNNNGSSSSGNPGRITHSAMVAGGGVSTGLAESLLRSDEDAAAAGISAASELGHSLFAPGLPSSTVVAPDDPNVTFAVADASAAAAAGKHRLEQVQNINDFTKAMEFEKEIAEHSEKLLNQIQTKENPCVQTCQRLQIKFEKLGRLTTRYIELWSLHGRIFASLRRVKRQCNSAMHEYQSQCRQCQTAEGASSAQPSFSSLSAAKKTAVDCNGLCQARMIAKNKVLEMQKEYEHWSAQFESSKKDLRRAYSELRRMDKEVAALIEGYQSGHQELVSQTKMLAQMQSQLARLTDLAWPSHHTAADAAVAQDSSVNLNSSAGLQVVPVVGAAAVTLNPGVTTSVAVPEPPPSVQDPSSVLNSADVVATGADANGVTATDSGGGVSASTSAAATAAAAGSDSQEMLLTFIKQVPSLFTLWGHYVSERNKAHEKAMEVWSCMAEMKRNDSVDLPPGDQKFQALKLAFTQKNEELDKYQDLLRVFYTMAESIYIQSNSDVERACRIDVLNEWNIAQRQSKLREQQSAAAAAVNATHATTAAAAAASSSSSSSSASSSSSSSSSVASSSANPGVISAVASNNRVISRAPYQVSYANQGVRWVLMGGKIVPVQTSPLCVFTPSALFNRAGVIQGQQQHQHHHAHGAAAYGVSAAALAASGFRFANMAGASGIGTGIVAGAGGGPTSPLNQLSMQTQRSGIRIQSSSIADSSPTMSRKRRLRDAREEDESPLKSPRKRGPGRPRKKSKSMMMEDSVDIEDSDMDEDEHSMPKQKKRRKGGAKRGRSGKHKRQHGGFEDADMPSESSISASEIAEQKRLALVMEQHEQRLRVVLPMMKYSLFPIPDEFDDLVPDEVKYYDLEKKRVALKDESGLVVSSDVTTTNDTSNNIVGISNSNNDTNPARSSSRDPSVSQSPRAISPSVATTVDSSASKSVTSLTTKLSDAQRELMADDGFVFDSEGNLVLIDKLPKDGRCIIGSDRDCDSCFRRRSQSMSVVSATSVGSGVSLNPSQTSTLLSTSSSTTMIPASSVVADASDAVTAAVATSTSASASDSVSSLMGQLSCNVTSNINNNNNDDRINSHAESVDSTALFESRKAVVSVPVYETSFVNVGGCSSMMADSSSSVILPTCDDNGNEQASVDDDHGSHPHHRDGVGDANCSSMMNNNCEKSSTSVDRMYLCLHCFRKMRIKLRFNSRTKSWHYPVACKGRGKGGISTSSNGGGSLKGGSVQAPNQAGRRRRRGRGSNSRVSSNDRQNGARFGRPRGSRKRGGKVVYEELRPFWIANPYLEYDWQTSDGSMFRIRSFKTNDIVEFHALDVKMTKQLMGEGYESYGWLYLHSRTALRRLGYQTWHTLALTKLTEVKADDNGDSGNTGVVRYEESRPLGFIMYNLNRRAPRNSSYVELFWILVDNCCRRKGIAQRMIDVMILDSMRSWEGVWNFRLHVLVDNPAGIALYKKMGFREVSLKKSYPSEGYNSFRYLLEAPRKFPNVPTMNVRNDDNGREDEGDGNAQEQSEIEHPLDVAMATESDSNNSNLRLRLEEEEEDSSEEEDNRKDEDYVMEAEEDDDEEEVETTFESDEM